MLCVPRRRVPGGGGDISGQLGHDAACIWNNGVCVLGPRRVPLGSRFHETPRTVPQGVRSIPQQNPWNRLVTNVLTCMLRNRYPPYTPSEPLHCSSLLYSCPLSLGAFDACGCASLWLTAFQPIKFPYCCCLWLFICSDMTLVASLEGRPAPCQSIPERPCI